MEFVSCVEKPVSAHCGALRGELLVGLQRFGELRLEVCHACHARLQRALPLLRLRAWVCRS